MLASPPLRLNDAPLSRCPPNTTHKARLKAPRSEGRRSGLHAHEPPKHRFLLYSQTFPPHPHQSAPTLWKNVPVQLCGSTRPGGGGPSVCAPTPVSATRSSRDEPRTAFRDTARASPLAGPRDCLGHSAPRTENGRSCGDTKEDTMRSGVRSPLLATSSTQPSRVKSSAHLPTLLPHSLHLQWPRPVRAPVSARADRVLARPPASAPTQCVLEGCPAFPTIPPAAPSCPATKGRWPPRSALCPPASPAQLPRGFQQRPEEKLLGLQLQLPGHHPDPGRPFLHMLNAAPSTVSQQKEDGLHVLPSLSTLENWAEDSGETRSLGNPKGPSLRRGRTRFSLPGSLSTKRLYFRFQGVLHPGLCQLPAAPSSACHV